MQLPMIVYGQEARRQDASSAGQGAALRQAAPEHEDGSDCLHAHGMGTTWIELYVLYRLAGKPEPIQYTAEDASSRPTLRMQLHAFRRGVRRVVQLAMPASLHWLFKGEAHGNRRLGSLGITTYLATLPWQPCLTKDAQNRLAIEVLRSQHRLTTTKAQQALLENKLLPLRSLQLKGRTKWSRQLRPLKQPLYSHPPPAPSPPSQAPQHTTTTSQEHITASTSSSTNPADFAGHQASLGQAVALQLLAPGSEANSAPPPPLTCIVFFRCPRCPHQLPGTKPAFATNNLDRRIWCNQCQKSLFSRLWQCSCGLPWHGCPRHQGEPERLRALREPAAPTAPAGPPRRPPKRKLGQGRDEMIQRWLDHPQPKRSRPPPTEVELGVVEPLSSGIKHHLLGPKLRAKFPKLSSTQPVASSEPTTASPARSHTSQLRSLPVPPTGATTTAPTPSCNQDEQQ